MARVWYVGTYPYREITPNDWDKVGLFGPHYQWSADNGWSVDQAEFRPALLAVLSQDPEFMLNQTGVRPDTPTPPDDVTRPYKIDASILALVDDAFEALDMAETALEDIQTSVTAANTAATQSGTFRNQAQTFRNEAETFKTAAGTSASDASTSAATATTKAGEASSWAAAAKTSETNAEESEDNAALSATAAGISETNAGTSASQALSYRNTASTHAGTATTKASEAQGFRNEAEGFRNQALAAKLSWKGVWSSGTAYIERDVVSHNGSSWWAKQPSTGVQPTEGASWSLVASKGDEGQVSQAMLDAAVASLVGGAPEALDTLTELADALGNDPNFATTVSTAIGQRALIDGAPVAYNTLGKLVTALQNHELGGSTDASLLTGALTDQLEAGGAMVEADLNFPGGPGVTTDTLAEWIATIYDMSNRAQLGLGEKAGTNHTHTAAEVGAEPVAWSGTQAQYDAIGTKEATRTYNIIEG